MNKKVLKRALRGVTAAALIAGIGWSTAYAQTPADAQRQQQGIANPARVEKQFPAAPYQPGVEARVEVREGGIQQAPEGAEDIKFTLQDLAVAGVTVYTAADLRPLYDQSLGQTISLADLYKIAADLTRKYRNDGYILTQVVVPPQTIEGGSANLKVVEGFISKITVTGGESQFAMDLVRAYAAQARTGGPLNVRDLERALLLINDLPGMNARSILTPSKSEAGGADLRIIIDRKPYDAYISLDNYGTRFLGPWQVGGAVSLNSYFGANEKITGQIVVAPDMDDFNELVYAALSYEQPVMDQGTMLKLFTSFTETDPGYQLDQFGVEGWSAVLNATVEHPFIRSRTMNLNGRVTFDYREVTSKNNINLDPTRRDHIRALRIGGNGELIDTLMGLVGYNNLDVEFSRGLDILGSNRQGQADMSRPAADPTFYKLTAEYQRLQRISSAFSLLLGVTGQWSNAPLQSAEEFSVGGINYGRGYDSSEVIGDDGIAGKVELQWKEPYELSMLETYELFSFYDAGRVWNEDATTSSRERETLTSAGLGFRADLGRGTGGGAFVAWPLNTTPQTTGDQGPRFYFNINRHF